MKNITNMASDIIQNISSSTDIEECVVSLRFLYSVSSDSRLRILIVDKLTELGYCLECGEKMEYFEWTEPRPLGSETMCSFECPNCRER